MLCGCGVSGPLRAAVRAASGPGAVHT
ncbi:hypothetical protein AB0L82_27300 [Nocardia sp. NPDC052001]